MFVAFTYGSSDRIRKVYVSAEHVTHVVPASNVTSANPGKADIHLMGGQAQRVNESADEVVAKLAKYLDDGPMAPPGLGSVDI